MVWAVAFANAAYPALLTSVSSIQKPSTHTRWRGFASFASASSEPIQKQPPGTQAMPAGALPGGGLEGPPPPDAVSQVRHPEGDVLDGTMQPVMSITAIAIHAQVRAPCRPGRTSIGILWFRDEVSHRRIDGSEDRCFIRHATCGTRRSTALRAVPGP